MENTTALYATVALHPKMRFIISILIGQSNLSELTMQKWKPNTYGNLRKLFNSIWNVDNANLNYFILFFFFFQ